MSIKSLLAASAVAVAALVAPAAQAALFSGCNTDQATTGQNVTFCFNQTSATQLTFTITNADNATGDWAGIAALAGFSLKDLGVDFSGGIGATATYSGGGTFIGANEQINAKLCSTSGTPNGSICFGGSTFPGMNLAIAHTMSFTIDLTGGGVFNILPTGPHLQIVFEDKLDCTESKGPPPEHCKQGSIYSRNIPGTLSSSGPSSSGPSSSGPGLPEPGTLALLGAALASLAVLRRRGGFRI